MHLKLVLRTLIIEKAYLKTIDRRLLLESYGHSGFNFGRSDIMTCMEQIYEEEHGQNAQK